MSTYHLNPETGIVGLCHASVRACPISTKEFYFENEHDAHRAYEIMTHKDLWETFQKRPKNESYFDVFKRKVEEIYPLELEKFTDASEERSAVYGTVEDREAYLWWLENLEKEEVQALQAYKNGESKRMNDILRNVDFHNPLLTKHIQTLNKLIQREGTREEKILYHGWAADRLTREEFHQWLEEFEPGRIINVKNFMSLAESPVVANTFKGGRGIILEVITDETIFTNTEERESITQSGTCWKIINKTLIRDANQWYEVIQMIRKKEYETI